MPNSDGAEIPLPFTAPTAWSATPLRLLCALIADGDWVELKDQGGGQDYRLLQISNIGLGTFIETGKYRWITEKTFGRLRCTEIKVGDVLVARMPEPTGRCWFVKELPWRAVTAVDVAIVRTDESKLDSRFLSYYLNSPQCLNVVTSLTTGTTRLRIRRADIERLIVPLPPLAEQRAIAEVLGALDDKIEANQRLAERSDELAAALVSNATKTNRRIEEIAMVVMGQSPPGPTYNEEGIGLPFYQGRRDFGFRSPVRRVWCSAPSRIAKQNDVLVSVRAPVGSLNVATERCAIGRGVAALRSTQFPSILYHVMATDSSLWFPYESEGTVFGSIGKTQLHQMVIDWPSDEIVELENAIAPLDETVAVAVEEQSLLATLRDALLPKLMSGELRVRDAEHLVEDAL